MASRCPEAATEAETHDHRRVVPSIPQDMPQLEIEPLVNLAAIFTLSSPSVSQRLRLPEGKHVITSTLASTRRVVKGRVIAAQIAAI